MAWAALSGGGAIYREPTYRLFQACRPKFLQSLMSTPFLRDTPLSFEHVLNVPLLNPLRMNGFYYFAYVWPDIRVLHFSGYLGLERSHTSSEKKKNFVNGSAGAHETRCAKFRVYLSKTA